MDEGCINLNFLLGSTAVGTTAASRNWNIQVKSNFFNQIAVMLSLVFCRSLNMTATTTILLRMAAHNTILDPTLGLFKRTELFKTFFQNLSHMQILRLYSFLFGKNKDTLCALQAIGPHIVQCT